MTFYLIIQQSMLKANFKNNKAEVLKKKLCLTSASMHQGLLQMKNLAAFQFLNYVNLSQ